MPNILLSTLFLILYVWPRPRVWGLGSALKPTRLSEPLPPHPSGAQPCRVEVLGVSPQKAVSPVQSTVLLLPCEAPRLPPMGHRGMEEQNPQRLHVSEKY